MDIFRFELGEIDDSGDQQLLRGFGLPGEEFAKAPRIMPHGLASRPPKGSHGIGIAVNGRRDEVVVLGLEQPGSRPKNLPDGGTTLYDASGNKLELSSAGGNLDTGAQPFAMKSGQFTIEATEIVLKVGDTVIRLRDGRIDLGAMTAPNRVLTEGGPSSTVYAVL
ncbi:MAG: phage baseplate assembly protein [Bosea sp.]|uniref:phage baseplate assembly protein n=1 Tax=Bosea sp. (in: a-proteobacteria) TaxID=1871050 RepID=UPI001AD4FCBB|nr:phage baseplate assembly protein [Bosea sp. (in: a-proteobacteria)]MBN9453263.1 phage baseplate assembly protein [Bosea sp. (in: a-proteobacteria)]